MGLDYKSDKKTRDATRRTAVGGLADVFDGLHLGLDGAANVRSSTRLEDEETGRLAGPVSAFQRERLAAETVSSYVAAPAKQPPRHS